MPVCRHCGYPGGVHRESCMRGFTRLPDRVNRIRYPSPNVLGLSARKAA